MSEAPLLEDPFGRSLNYLRISVTDRCDLRCTYCMPPEGIRPVSRSELLTFEEIERLVRLLGRHGLRRVRITGGEPLLRRDLPRLVEELADVSGLRPIALTTNGTFLPEHLDDLLEAGLGEINVSIDSLDPDRYERLTRGGDVARPLEAIGRALERGIRPKVNAVILPDLTDREILDLVDLASFCGIAVRFIEFMPLCGTGWQTERFVPADRVEEVVRRHHRLEPLERRPDGVAETFEVDGGPGRVGLIASISRPFCRGCSRLRLTSDGVLKPCLFSSFGVPLRPLLATDASDEALLRAVRRAVLGKPEGHGIEVEELEGVVPEDRPLIRAMGG